ncbi:hypothetical protein OG426_10325 [Streptomyces canus]|uniref:hypothetical protein n=1 Tax=Streptomyces canus TaxID=58343 RepID=UPI0022557799|nr:hypothetical protein [Streptomyces canus]MCX4862177.1 hypothetical protein [Streptomyces canus]WSW32831.1 hypothetical protein OG426_10325 [Streptomyces canus]
MAVTGAAGDAQVVAVRAALEPFAWQSFTAELVCRRAVAALDGGPPFPRPRGSRNGLTPQEECAEALVEILNGYRWRSLTIDGVSRLLVGAVLAWRQERAWFDIRLVCCWTVSADHQQQAQPVVTAGPYACASHWEHRRSGRRTCRR